MKICIPTQSGCGLEAGVFGHFGSAPFFTIVDVESRRLEVVRNAPHHLERHSCHHLDVLTTHGIDAVVCSGVGRRAFAALREAGVDLLTPAAGTVSEIVESIRRGSVCRMDEEEACEGGRHEHCQGEGEPGVRRGVSVVGRSGREPAGQASEE